MSNNNNTVKQCIVMSILAVHAFFILSREASTEERTSQFKGVSVKLSSGYSYSNVGDLNTWISSWNYYYDTNAAIDGYMVPEKFKNLHHGYNFEGEIWINLTSRWATALGVGQITMKNKSTHIYRSPTNDDYKNLLTNSVKITPITIGIYYSIPLFSKIKLFLSTGVGYYFAKLSMFNDYQRPDDNWAKWQKNMSSSDFGFLGGMGLEWNIKNNLALIVEARGQYAKITPFEGTRKQESSNGYIMEDQGIFYTWNQWRKRASALSILPWKPDPAWNIRDIREFMLNLRGISLRIGIRIGIF